MKLFFMLSAIVILSLSAKAQYPVEILPGQHKSFSAGTDTLWVLSNGQFNKALASGKKLKLVEEEVKLFKDKESLFIKKSAKQDSLISIMTANRDNYEKKWNTCEADLATVGAGYETERRKKRIFKWLAIVGIPSAFIAGILIN